MIYLKSFMVLKIWHSIMALTAILVSFNHCNCTRSHVALMILDPCNRGGAAPGEETIADDRG